MLTVETIVKIRRAYFSRGKLINDDLPGLSGIAEGGPQDHAKKITKLR